MTRLTLDIPDINDLNLLLALIERLEIEVVNSTMAPDSIQVHESITVDYTPNPIIKPLRKKLITEDLKKEQRYKGFNRKRLDSLILEIDIPEPLALLLEQNNN